ncbi:sigma 54-interacting transcriptional regulator [Pelosinus sp. IPA-1]|uniref:sigma 54-interacting transcriptional regulator n=1 Tax=Pelosinus sp. IPA-1 TaxID=3029569 RepID=UPI0024362BA2|nr:sigma 54-interacting transcriptional regulator [Pelosinus sp. IPA-1]GMB00142.1 PTS sugar transporter [Pelosinus sp. IPA-1]
MDLKEKMLGIIRTENIKDPFTDVRLAKMLSTTREQITILRKELGIGNSRERRKPYLKKTIETIVKGNSKLNITEITKKLMESGFDISRHVVEEFFSESSIDNIPDEEEIVVLQDPFANLVGHNGSLENNVIQSKSAILYPPFGLATLIIGESGVGKTQFAECMYNFAKQKKVIGETIPFIVFNCADYSDNPQLLLSLLYGYKKGAFTGADSDTEGIVEHANNGILFLDEIHRLPPKGQEILFSILDRGQFRRLGETKDERKVKIMFIGATTENIESNLLLSFRRRIPMIISIPSLHERAFVEKVEIIYDFFQKECNRINVKIFVESKVIEILTLKRFNGNIGQLKSTIQVVCARAFMKNIGKDSEIISIGYEDILETNSIQRDFILEDINIIEIRNYIQDMLFIPFIKNSANFIKDIQNNECSVPEDFYRQIEKKYYDLIKLNINFSEVEEILWTFISNKFSNLESSLTAKNKYFSLTELVNIADKDIIVLVKKVRLQLIKEHLYNEINENIFIYLAIHLDETVKRIRLKQPIININLSKIKKDFAKEYNIAHQVGNWLKELKDVELPEDEIGFIAMYIKAAVQNKTPKNRVGVVVVSHGKIATEIINVVRELLNVTFPIAIDMPLDESPAMIYEKIIGISKIVDEGRGILFLVDMGSLVNAGKIVTEKLQIQTQTLDRVDLLTVIEAVRKASIPENNLNEIYASLVKSRYNYPLLSIEETSKPIAIVALCLTGEGTAYHIRQAIEKKYPNVTVFQVGVMDDHLRDKIQEIQEKFKILTIIGTINPEIEGVNFIVYDPYLLSSGIREFDLILNSEKGKDLANFSKEDLFVFESSITAQKELIEVMCLLLINKGYVKKEFLQSVLKREEMSPTFMKGGMAIPHGESNIVNKSAIVVAKLKQPMAWGGGKAKIVCLPAFKINDKKIVKGLLKPFLNLDFVEGLKDLTDINQFREILFAKMKE